MIDKNFFRLQRRAHRQPGLVPVANVDHPLDEAIPFRPGWAMIYHDFSAFWVRTAACLARSVSPLAASDFIDSVGTLYVAAAEVYFRHLSTTTRPRYFGNIGCIVIQLFDPHLFCVPSLHVLVCVHTWIKARHLLEKHGISHTEKAYIEKLFRRAVLITESILYMKQHSVNCIPAALYAMHCFEPALFTRKETQAFTQALFADERNAEIPHETREHIRLHIETICAAFMREREHLLSIGNDDWTIPLITFLKNYRPPSKTP
ncbi:MAG: hypothetical protein LBT00_10525 [Spirochaetaceae bacterium]|nr:hypothetical protein [Spirochaetaceae bacterium]